MEHTSTWSFDQLSMLRDLTLEMCVPSLRCNEAHRMHRKMPSCSNIGQLNVLAREESIRRTLQLAQPMRIHLASRKVSARSTQAYLDSLSDSRHIFHFQGLS